MTSIIKRDDVKQKWEETEFPLVCETCLGDNPYVRMTKERHGKKCQICETPFTVFAWQAGTKGRLKRVEICKCCAQAKNVCQVCIYDLQYGLPVKVRDKVLRETSAVGGSGGSGSGSGGSGGSGSGGAFGMAIPQSRANRSWYTAQQERALEQQGSGSVGSTGVNDLAHAKLQEMARMEPRYERNLPKLCSFYARGECDRGANCPFRHEMPRDRNDPLSNQNTKDRFYGTNDPVAGKIIHKQRRREQKQEQLMLQQQQQQSSSSSGGGEYDKARATLYLRFQGFPKKNLPSSKQQDPSSSSLSSSSLSQQQQQQQQQALLASFPVLTEMDIRDQFYSFGEIVSVRVQPEHGQAFVEYTQPEATELAIASMNRKQLLGKPIFVAWARAPKRGDNTSAAMMENTSSQSLQSSSSPPKMIRPATPPGGGNLSTNHHHHNHNKNQSSSTTTTTSSSSSSTTTSVLPNPVQFALQPPPEVAAIVAARKQQQQQQNNNNNNNNNLLLPQPGGGVLRRGVGMQAAKRTVMQATRKQQQQYYPSADPTRLGSSK